MVPRNKPVAPPVMKWHLGLNLTVLGVALSRFYDFRSVAAGSEETWKINVWEKLPNVALFYPLGVSRLVLGYPWTSFSLPFLVIFAARWNHIFCKTSPARAHFHLPAFSFSASTSHLNFIFSIYTLWLSFFSFYVDFDESCTFWQRGGKPPPSES